jgi:shikimate kinase
MKILFVGYMCSGKSLIASELAKRIGLKWMDLDFYIEQNEGQSISEIFKNKGEIYFRKIENQYLKELLTNNEDFILSVGGGTPCYYNNMNLINNNSKSFYLKSSVKNLTNRIKKGKENRPLVANISDKNLSEFIAKHLFERSKFYLKSKYVVDTIDKEVDDIINEIISLI